MDGFSCYGQCIFHSDFKISRFTIGAHISCVLEKTLKGGKVYGKEGIGRTAKFEINGKTFYNKETSQYTVRLRPVEVFSFD